MTFHDLVAVVAFGLAAAAAAAAAATNTRRVVLHILQRRVFTNTLVHFAFGGVAHALARLLLDDLDFDLHLLCLGELEERCVDGLMRESMRRTAMAKETKTHRVRQCSEL